MKKALSIAAATLIGLAHRYDLIGRAMNGVSERAATSRMTIPMHVLLRRLDAEPDVRHDLIGRVRREIAAGEYETPAKIDAATEALAEDMAMGL